MDDTYTGNTHILQTQLEKYVRQGLYPLHMPGHKRLMQPAPGLPSSWDLTEVAGTDDLHDAGGILSDAMKRTARLWGGGKDLVSGQRLYMRTAGSDPVSGQERGGGDLCQKLS